MKLTAQADYSLRVLSYVSLRPATPSTVPEIAAAYGLSHNHLSKVAQNLSKLGYLRATRGRNGGFLLAAPPEEINLGDLLRSVEPDLNLVECFDPGTDHCAISPACRLKGILRESMGAFLGVLDRYTLADLMANRQRMMTLLEIEPARTLVSSDRTSSPQPVG